MNKIISDPTTIDPVVLIGMIENSPTAFTNGRRNNDIVNWFIACRLSQLAMGTLFHGAYPMSQEFKRRFIELQRHGLTPVQNDALDRWDEEVADKIGRLCYSYYHRSADQLATLWLPMDYKVVQVHEDQMSLL